MNKFFQIFAILTLITVSFSGAFLFGHELKKSSDLREKREHMKFQRDSLELELYKNQLKNETNSNR